MIAEVFGELTLAGTIRLRAQTRGGAAICRVQLVNRLIAGYALITTITTHTMSAGMITGETIVGRIIRGIHHAIITTAITTTTTSIVPGTASSDLPQRRMVPLLTRQRGYHDA